MVTPIDGFKNPVRSLQNTEDVAPVLLTVEYAGQGRQVALIPPTE
jgi:hypothetical protein